MKGSSLFWPGCLDPNPRFSNKMVAIPGSIPEIARSSRRLLHKGQAALTGFLEGNTRIWWRLITSVPFLANPPGYQKLRAVYRLGAPNRKALARRRARLLLLREGVRNAARTFIPTWLPWLARAHLSPLGLVFLLHFVPKLLEIDSCSATMISSSTCESRSQVHS